MRPIIHILLASYNRAHLIKHTLDSIKEQTYGNWKCFITDDNSSDGTENIVREYVRRDERFEFFLKPKTYKQGLSDTRNFGLDLAAERNAQYIQFFDDDDLMNPKKLELQIAPFLENPDLNFSICKFEKLIEMEKDKCKIERPEYLLNFPHIGDAMLNGHLKMNSLSAIWNMQILNKFRFDNRLSYAEEWELFTRIGYHYPGNYGIVDEYLFSYRKHPDTLTMGKDENYERKKSSAISRIILLHYLTQNRLHTEQSIVFFAKTFLIYTYRPDYVQVLLNYVNENSDFRLRLKLFLQYGLSISKLHRKTITKISTWV